MEGSSWNDMCSGMKNMSAAIRQVGITAARMTEAVRKAAIYMFEFVESHYPNKHVKHLCKYGYGRTKKKNLNRVTKHIQKQAKLELRRKKK